MGNETFIIITSLAFYSTIFFRVMLMISVYLCILRCAVFCSFDHSETWIIVLARMGTFDMPALLARFGLHAKSVVFPLSISFSKSMIFIIIIIPNHTLGYSITRYIHIKNLCAGDFPCPISLSDNCFAVRVFHIILHTSTETTRSDPSPPFWWKMSCQNFATKTITYYLCLANRSHSSWFLVGLKTHQ